MDDTVCVLRYVSWGNKFLRECAHLFDVPSDDEVHLKVGILLVQLAKYYSW
jgi:hypothetical protein